MSGRLPVLGEDFTYTGNCQVIEDSVANGQTNWRIKFLTSGVLTFASGVIIDAFYVGGGGGGVNARRVGTPSAPRQGSGGGGGYTKTVSDIEIIKNTSYQITIGSGGLSHSSNSTARVYGGSSSGFGNSISGGSSGVPHVTDTSEAGGNGGSGGGTSIDTSISQQPTQGTGGADGAKGSGGYGIVGSSSLYAVPGKGQGTTTREFGEVGATVYSGGGGCGGIYYYTGYSGSETFKYRSYPGSGGSGGGGTGGASYKPSSYTNAILPSYIDGKNGTANTGGGGGGAGIVQTTNGNDGLGSGGSGGSGIVIIRNHRE